MRKISEIENVRDHYYVTTCGKVISMAYGKPHILSPFKCIKAGGYITLRLCLKTNDNKKLNFTVSRLVAKAFIENHDNKDEVDHIDRNPLNNSVLNLRWATREENIANRTMGWKTPIKKLVNPIDVYDLNKVYITTMFNSEHKRNYTTKSFAIGNSKSIKNGGYYKHNGYLFKYYEGVETIPDECKGVGQ